jgi:recombination protein RecT
VSRSQELVQQQNGPAQMVKQYTGALTAMLPSHIKGDAWMRLATKALRNDDLRKVAERNPASLVTALMECARLGHEPCSPEFALVPMGAAIEGWESYRGKIERIYRAGAVESVIAEVVYSSDKFEYVPGRDARPIHEIDWDADDRGELRLVYAYAVMKGGAISKVVVLNKAQVMKHKLASKTSSRSDSMWVKWEDQAWLKTGVHQLEKWVPTSAEYVREQLRAVRDVESEAAGQRMDRQQPANTTTVQAGPSVQATVVDEPEGVVDVATGEIDPDDYDPTASPEWGQQPA